MYHNKLTRIIAAVIAGLLAILMMASTIFGALTMAGAVSEVQLNDKLENLNTHKVEVERQLAAD